MSNGEVDSALFYSQRIKKDVRAWKRLKRYLSHVSDNCLLMGASKVPKQSGDQRPKGANLGGLVAVLMKPDIAALALFTS